MFFQLSRKLLPMERPFGAQHSRNGRDRSSRTDHASISLLVQPVEARYTWRPAISVKLTSVVKA
jgi:hypothetical protein